MRIMNFWDSTKLFWQSTFNSTYDESLKFQLQQNMGERECHPTFCCRIIAQNRTWYVRDKSRCGSTWQVIWTNVSSIPRAPGSRSHNDANLLLAHSHRFVLLLILLPRQQQPREQSALRCIGKGSWETLKKSTISWKILMAILFLGMIYGMEQVNIFLSLELGFYIFVSSQSKKKEESSNSDELKF